MAATDLAQHLRRAAAAPAHEDLPAPSHARHLGEFGGRFIGDCGEATLGVADVTQTTNECQAIRILTSGNELARSGGEG